MKRFLIAFGIILVLLIAFGVYYYEGSLPAEPQNKETRTFVIRKGEDVNTIINNLAKEDLIRNRIVFFLHVKRLGIENSIQAGLFRLTPSMNAEEIALSLTRGSDDIWITIIEGLRKEEIAQIISADFGIPETEFINQTEEGRLFPDTYLVPRTATLSQILNLFESNFAVKYDNDQRERARELGLTDNEVLTLASMVEREAKSPESMRQVASIMLRRLDEDYPLQIDATVQYAIGYQEREGTWWKKNLTLADLKVDSPYNTYENVGLPPAPICNPGLDAINAVLAADRDTPYFYYISNKDGSQMHYARTLEEHNENIRKYLR